MAALTNSAWAEGPPTAWISGNDFLVRPELHQGQQFFARLAEYFFWGFPILDPSESKLFLESVIPDAAVLDEYSPWARSRF